MSKSWRSTETFRNTKDAFRNTKDAFRNTKDAFRNTKDAFRTAATAFQQAVGLSPGTVSNMNLDSDTAARGFLQSAGDRLEEAIRATTKAKFDQMHIVATSISTQRELENAGWKLAQMQGKFAQMQAKITEAEKQTDKARARLTKAIKSLVKAR
jgi:hypothetical protein